MIRVVLLGAAGRMGRAIVAVAGPMEDVTIKACVDREPNFPEVGGVWTSRAADVVAAGDVVVDFSSPEGTLEAAGLCAARGAPLVTGTTGLGEAHAAALQAAGARVAVLQAANFSLGVLALQRALRAALRALPPTWDVEIVERHHRQKADSPSGTALVLAEEVRAVRGTASATLRHGREGRVGPRPAGEVGMHAVRGGTWVGDHTVLMAGEGEWLELRHVAQDRAAFAAGALAAARFVAQAPPGRYTLEHLASDPGRVT
jgi:4-hydroxy-tetrahydrodipicolinate reductase